MVWNDWVLAVISNFFGILRGIFVPRVFLEAPWPFHVFRTPSIPLLGILFMVSFSTEITRCHRYTIPILFSGTQHGEEIFPTGVLGVSSSICSIFRQPRLSRYIPSGVLISINLRVLHHWGWHRIQIATTSSKLFLFPWFFPPLFFFPLYKIERSFRGGINYVASHGAWYDLHHDSWILRGLWIKFGGENGELNWPFFFHLLSFAGFAWFSFIGWALHMYIQQVCMGWGMKITWSRAEDWDSSFTWLGKTRDNWMNLIIFNEIF